jgi:hypothetical protein
LSEAVWEPLLEGRRGRERVRVEEERERGCDEEGRNRREEWG